MKARFLRVQDHNLLLGGAVDALFRTLATFHSEQVVVALPGGRSVVPFLQKIVERSNELSDEAWHRLEIFMLDERVVPLDHADSNFGAISEHLSMLVSNGKLTVEQLHPFIANFELKDYGAKGYAAELQQFGGRFHVAIAGVGEDGHIGALFPRHPSVDDSAPYFITLEDSPKPPSRRMSASRSLVGCSHTLIGLFLGEAKRTALQRFMDTDLTVHDCPAKLLNSVEQAYIVTDLEGSLLSERP